MNEVKKPKPRPSQAKILQATTCVHGMIGPCNDCAQGNFESKNRVTVARYEVTLPAAVDAYMRKLAATAGVSSEEFITECVALRLRNEITKAVINGTMGEP